MNINQNILYKEKKIFFLNEINSIKIYYIKKKKIF